MNQLLDIITSLVESNIAFTIHYPSGVGHDKPSHFVVTIKQSLDRIQLGVAVELGGSLDKSGTVMLMGEL